MKIEQLKILETCFMIFWYSTLTHGRSTILYLYRILRLLENMQQVTPRFTQEMDYLRGCNEGRGSNVCFQVFCKWRFILVERKKEKLITHQTQGYSVLWLWSWIKNPTFFKRFLRRNMFEDIFAISFYNSHPLQPHFPIIPKNL